SCVVSGLSADSSYRFRVRAINAIGVSGFSPPSVPVSATPGGTGVRGASGELSAGRFTRERAYVLPAAAAAQVERLTMTVSDVSGRVVWEKSVRPAASGAHEIAWDGSAQGVRAPAGMYVARVRAVGFDGTTQDASHRYMTLRHD